MLLDERKNRVLQAIVNDYVATAEPVGSRTLARKYDLGVSPATIRNEMADLEELGLLEQPHTSAGRVPSDRGYRYFVDELMERVNLHLEHEVRIHQAFDRRMRAIDQLVRETAAIVAEISRHAVLVTAPQFGPAVLAEIRLVPLRGGRALVVYLTDTGFVENQIIDLPRPMPAAELERVAELLTAHLRGRGLDALGRGLLRDLQAQLSHCGTVLDQILEFMRGGLYPDDRPRVYVGGTTQILDQPEFRDVSKVRNLLSLLEQQDVVRVLLDAGTRQTGVHVNIGGEIQIEQMQDCSLITATYQVSGQTVGRIGVVGPKRMDYAFVVALVDAIKRHMSEAVARWAGR